LKNAPNKKIINFKNTFNLKGSNNSNNECSTTINMNSNNESINNNNKEEQNNQKIKIKIKKINKTDLVSNNNSNEITNSLIPSLSSSITNTLQESVLNAFIKDTKKKICFENENTQEIIFNEISIPKIKIKNEIKIEKPKNNININGIIIDQDYKEKKDIYEAHKYLNLMSSVINNENYEDEEDDDDEKTIINDDYGNLTDSFFDSKIIFNNNVNLNKNNILKKSIFGPKEKNDVEKLKNDIEKKLGKDFTDYLINYVSSESDKKSIQFNRNKIAEQLKNDFNSKKINVNRDLLNKGMELLPDIFSVIIGKRIEEENE
jgi:hypothetical protein